MTFPYDVVLFDLDGTLFDADEGITSSVRHTLNCLGIDCPEQKDLRFVVGPPLRASLSELGVPPEQIEEAMAIYRKDFFDRGMNLYRVYPHIRQLLQILKDNHVYTAVATSKPRHLGIETLRRFHMLSYFNAVVGEDDGAAKKGKDALVRMALPDGYRNAAMVGDRCFDIEGAKRNGIDGIGVLFGCGSLKELQDAGATYIAETPLKLLSYLCPDAPIPKGFFLSIEGPDGSGKTTQINLLEKSLLQLGFDVKRTREPGGTPISEKIRKIVLDPENMEMCDTCEALLYAAARAQHVNEVIRPSVQEGKLVLCDRFVDSSVAYQGGGRELGVKTIQEINAPAVAGMMPDATLYLSIDADEALRRRYAASNPDRLEMADLAFHRRVQLAYEQLVHEDCNRFAVVNAAQDIDSVAKEALRAVLKKLLPFEEDA